MVYPYPPPDALCLDPILPTTVIAATTSLNDKWGEYNKKLKVGKKAFNAFKKKQEKQYKEADKKIKKFIEETAESLKKGADSNKDNAFKIIKALKKHAVNFLERTNQIYNNVMTIANDTQIEYYNTVDLYARKSVECALIEAVPAGQAVSLADAAAQRYINLYNEIADMEIKLADDINTKGILVANSITQMILDIVDSESHAIDQFRNDMNRWTKWPNLNRHVDFFINFMFYFRPHVEAFFVILSIALCASIIQDFCDIVMDAKERMASLNRMNLDYEISKANLELKRIAFKRDEDIAIEEIPDRCG